MRNPGSIHVRVTLLATVLFALTLVAAGSLSRSHAAPAKPADSVPVNVMHTDDYQRSARLDTYRVIADSGAGAAKTFISTSAGCATTSTPRPALTSRNCSSTRA